jgi:ribosomal protein S18 acetylase RimI-like enzyme
MAGTTSISAETAPATEVKKPRLRVTFRKAAQRDIEPMAKVFQRAFAATNEFKNAVGYLDHARHDGDYRLVVAKDPDGKVAGFVMTDFNSFTDNSIYVSQLAVDPDYQGHGIGRELMKKAEGLALKHGYNKVALHVRKDNEKAIALYKSLGYKKVGSDWWYYADGTTGLEMVKSLRPAAANDNKGWGIGQFLKKTFGFSP